MPAARRAALLEWAEHTGAVIIEDDYNSELRYRIAPQPTLSALAADARVLTLGTFTTLLSRHLSAGYVVADDRSAPALLEAREALGMPVSSVTQHAIAHLLDGGYVRRNTKAVHSRLLRRRRVIQERVIPALRQLGAEAVAGKDTVGVDIAVTFLDARLEAEFRNRLSDAGVECGRLAASSSEPRVGCVLSFAHLSDDDFEMAVSTLASLTPRH